MFFCINGKRDDGVRLKIYMLCYRDYERYNSDRDVVRGVVRV